LFQAFFSTLVPERAFSFCIKISRNIDPTCGSGSLLLRIGKEAKVARYYGQEFNSTTYNLVRMNMLLHGISFRNFDIKNDDTIERPRHMDLKFEAVVANPPYSACIC
jgi:type I restriction enzyme M protein